MATPILFTCETCGHQTWPVTTPLGIYMVCGWCDVPLIRAAHDKEIV